MSVMFTVTWEEIIYTKSRVSQDLNLGLQMAVRCSYN